MTPVLLHLLRHGEPETAGLLLGHDDAAPTRAGIDACREQVAGLEIAAIVASDLARARLAAAAIGRDRGLAVTPDPRWRELDFGDWNGLNPAAVPAEAMARFWDDPDANPPPAGERWSSLVARVAAAIGDCGAGPVLVVTHGGAMRAALAHLCAFAQPQLWAFDLAYAGLLSLKLWPGPNPSAQIVGLWP